MTVDGVDDRGDVILGEFDLSQDLVPVVLILMDGGMKEEVVDNGCSGQVLKTYIFLFS